MEKLFRPLQTVFYDSVGDHQTRETLNDKSQQMESGTKQELIQFTETETVSNFQSWFGVRRMVQEEICKCESSRC